MSNPESKDYGDVKGVEEIAQPLDAISGTPTLVGSVLTIPLTTAQTTIVSKHAVSGAILINDRTTYSTAAVPVLATATVVKTIVVTGSAAGADVLILDFANGTFAPGASGTVGITATLNGTAASVFKVRASAAADTITIGGTGTAADIAFNTDAYKDIAVICTAATTFTFSLGAGNDVFNASNVGATAALNYGTGGVVFAGASTVYGGPGNDTLTGGSGADTLYGDSGNDTLSGGSAVGANGADVYSGGAEADGGTGNDVVTYATQTGALAITVGAGVDDGLGEDSITGDVETVIGGSGADTFTGNTGDQTFFGGAGNDTFLMGLLASTGAGNDVVWGGTGTDTVSYLARIEGVTVTMDGVAANDGDTAGTEDDNIQADVENLICPDHACVVTGNSLDNTITGGTGDDSLTGGDGSDTFTGGAGTDTLTGGAGDDTFVMGVSTGIGLGADVISGGLGNDTVDMSAFAAVVTMVMDGATSASTNTMNKQIDTSTERFICPTGSACTITGNSLNNHIIGSTVDDTIVGLGGDDLIESKGSTIADTGHDDVDCGEGGDIHIITAGAAGTNVFANCEL